MGAFNIIVGSVSLALMAVIVYLGYKFLIVQRRYKEPLLSSFYINAALLQLSSALGNIVYGIKIV